MEKPKTVSAGWLNSGIRRCPKYSRFPVVTAGAIALGLTLAGCSDATNQIGSPDAEPTVAGITTNAPTDEPEPTDPPTTVTSEESEPEESSAAPTTEPAPAGLDPSDLEPTGLDVPILTFSDSIRRIDPDGAVTLIQRDEAIRVAGDTRGGVLFQRELVQGPQSSILWQPDGAAVPDALFVPEDGQRVELHGVTTATGSPEAVFSVTSPESDNRSLNRINLDSRVVSELRIVNDAEFGSRSTQVDGLFVVTTWQRENSAGWTVYQSGTGLEVGGSFPDIEAACADGNGRSCARLVSLSLDIQSVFRIVPHSNEAVDSEFDLLVTRSEDGGGIARVDLTSLEGPWYPEHMSELPDGRILLSRSVDPGHLRPTTGVVIDPTDGSIESLTEVGFVRLP